MKKEGKLAMKGYVKRAHQQLQHPTPIKYHYESTKYVPTEYTKKIQYSTEDTQPELTPLQRKHIQRVCGKFHLMEDLSTTPNYVHSTDLVSKQQQQQKRQKRHKKHLHNFLTTVQAIPMQPSFIEPVT